MTALSSSSITYQDIQAVRESVEDADIVIPAIFSMASIRYGKEKYNQTFVIGTSEDFEKLVQNLVTSGRYINKLDNVYRRRVVFTPHWMQTVSARIKKLSIQKEPFICGVKKNWPRHYLTKS